MYYYLIKIGDVFYGKHNINGRILDPRYIGDTNTLYLTVQEIGYKSQNEAIKAAKTLQKEKGLKASDVEINGILLEAV